MTHEKHTETLERLLDDLPVGPPPLGELLNAGRAARRRRRIALGSAAAVACLAVGGVTISTLGATGPSRGTDPSDRGGSDLVAVVGGAPMTGQQPHTAVWDPASRELVYLSVPAYSSSCPPTATARTGTAGAVGLEIKPDHGTKVCTADAGVVTVTVRGLPGEPTSLAVTTLDGTSSAPIVPLGAEQPPSREASILPCEQTRLVSLDIPGPGQPTPEQAVRPYVPGGQVVHQVLTSDRHATVTTVDAEGEVRRRYDLTLASDGWWPDGYEECLA